MPMVMALYCLLNTILSYFDIDVTIFSYISGVSIIPLVFIYLSSFVFKFCSHHRMFLYYIMTTEIINIYDWYIGIQVDSKELLMVHLIISGIFLFIILYLYVKNHKRNIT